MICWKRPGVRKMSSVGNRVGVGEANMSKWDALGQEDAHGDACMVHCGSLWSINVELAPPLIRNAM